MYINLNKTTIVTLTALPDGFAHKKTVPLTGNKREIALICILPF